MRVIKAFKQHSLLNILLAIYLAIYGSFSAHAACHEEFVVQTQAGRFELQKNGAVVRDHWTGLEWSRCLLGEAWNQDSGLCEGEAKLLSWADALAASASTNWSGEDGWRAANVKELESIIDRACSSPALNAEAFSGQSTLNSAAQWTSTPVENYAGGAWTVNFKNGSVIPSEKDSMLPVRLVKAL